MTTGLYYHLRVYTSQYPPRITAGSLRLHNQRRGRFTKTIRQDVLPPQSYQHFFCHERLTMWGMQMKCAWVFFFMSIYIAIYNLLSLSVAWFLEMQLLDDQPSGYVRIRWRTVNLCLLSLPDHGNGLHLQSSIACIAAWLSHCMMA